MILHRVEFRAMGCKMLALVESESEPSEMLEVPVWFEEWEQALSRFRSDSELTRLNASPGPLRPVSNVLWEVFEAAREAAETTEGLVTPLVLESLLYAGYDRSFDEFDHNQFTPSELGSRNGRELLGLDAIQLDASSRSIALPRGTLMDFGGIAKGWAAQRAAQRLGRWGPALVSAGGDIFVTGPRADGGAWQIGVEDPFNDGSYVEDLFLLSGGVATSGRDRRRWVRNGVPRHHIIDPRTGMPAVTDILTATVIGSSALRAEALAKATLISGSRVALDWLDGDDDLAGLLILDNGERLYSRNMPRYL